jgi:hypothetical protein
MPRSIVVACLFVGGVQFASGTGCGRVVSGVLGDITMVARLAFLIVRRKPSKARPLLVRAFAAALAHGPRHPHQCDHRDEAPDRVQVDGRPCGEEHAVESEQPGANEVEPLLGKRGGLDPAGREPEVGPEDE